MENTLYTTILEAGKDLREGLHFLKLGRNEGLFLRTNDNLGYRMVHLDDQTNDEVLCSTSCGRIWLSGVRKGLSGLLPKDLKDYLCLKRALEDVRQSTNLIPREGVIGWTKHHHSLFSLRRYSELQVPNEEQAVPHVNVVLLMTQPLYSHPSYMGLLFAWKVTVATTLDLMRGRRQKFYCLDTSEMKEKPQFQGSLEEWLRVASKKQKNSA